MRSASLYAGRTTARLGSVDIARSLAGGLVGRVHRRVRQSGADGGSHSATGSAAQAWRARTTVQRRSVRAPQVTSTTAADRRDHRGSETANWPTVAPVWRPRNAEPVRPQSCGVDERGHGTSTAVAPSAIASERHSRRTANHSSPTPGVTLVSRTNAQVARLAEAEHDRRGDQQVDVAVISSSSATGGNASSQTTLGTAPAQTV